MSIRGLPRIRFANLPTPLEEAKNLSDYMGGPRIFFKRDDLTGNGLGGNKVRKLEFIIGRALEEGCDTLIVCGGYQSNMVRITTALANQVGLKVELVLGGLPDEPKHKSGNLLLDHILGAKITYVDTVPRWEFGTALEDLADDLKAKGRKPYVIPLGGSSAEGMAGYITATEEMSDQFSELSISPDRLFVAIGSGGTYSGLVLGALNYSIGYEVAGISVSRTADYLRNKIPAEIRAASELLNMEPLSDKDSLKLYDEYVGEGYGELTYGCRHAIDLVARTEGVLLDPVYSGKAMAGMLDLINKGEVGHDETVVFLHTGGWPALFAYEPDQLLVEEN